MSAAKHTSVRLPPHLKKQALASQKALGYQTFTAYLCDILRRSLGDEEIKTLEARLAASNGRLERKFEELKQAQNALFTLTVGAVRELLPPEQADAAVGRILRAVRDDLSGRVPVPDVDEAPFPENEEEVPFGNDDGS